MQPILDEAAEQDETVPKLLAILNEHASQSSDLAVQTMASLCTGSWPQQHQGSAWGSR
jgi:hypothetical protein